MNGITAMFLKLVRIILLSAIGFTGFCYVYKRTHPPEQRLTQEQINVNYSEETRNYRSMKYFLLKPLDYDASKKYPLVVYFHCGDMPKRNRGESVPVMKPLHGMTPDILKKNPCFILTPQAPQRWWTDGKSGSLITEVRKYIDYHLMEELPIDSSRLYTIGYSAGGTAIHHALLWYPDYFAAAIPMAGWLHVPSHPAKEIKKMTQSQTAVWMFNATKDSCAEWWAIQDIWNAYSRNRGNVKLTRAEGGHTVPLQAFNSLCNGKNATGAQQLTAGPRCDTSTTDPMEWLFKQRL